jgi:hypothetical protein
LIEGRPKSKNTPPAMSGAFAPLCATLASLPRAQVSTASVVRPPSIVAANATVPALFSAGAGCSVKLANVPPPGAGPPLAATTTV